MSDVFLSYATEDKDRVAAIVKWLEELGYSVWWDEKIPLGKSFTPVIQEALDNARSVVVAWSDASVKSDWVRDEAAHGLAANVLIPVLLDDCKPPLGFQSRQNVRLTGVLGGERGVEWLRFQTALEGLLGPAPNRKKGEARLTVSRPVRSTGEQAHDDLDLRHDVSISLEEAFQGKTLEISYARRIRDQTVVQQKLNVEIPKGIDDEEAIFLSGEGNIGTDGVAGDLLLYVAVAPHPVFERDGGDLYARVAVPMTMAVLGGEKEISSLDGDKVAVSIVAGLQTGRRYRIKGRGMYRSSSSEDRGDLLVEMFVETPVGLSAEGRAAFEAFARIQDRSPGPGFFETVKKYFESNEAQGVATDPSTSKS